MAHAILGRGGHVRTLCLSFSLTAQKPTGDSGIPSHFPSLHVILMGRLIVVNGGLSHRHTWARWLAAGGG